ncbi:MAG TPA: matrixin family metalloprotease [Polyangiaceae bacterium]|nr:matrixin family metalloprotease [Polyangiaceae bacterium]
MPAEGGLGESIASSGALSIGSTGPGVQRVNAYLRDYGYLPNAELEASFPAWRSPVPTAPATLDVYDEATAAAVRILQSNHGLPETGVVDLATASLFEMTRCGVPDNMETPSHSNKYDIGTVSYPRGSTLTWKLTGSAPSGADFSTTSAKSMLATAFQQWGNVMGLTFVMDESGAAVNFNVRFSNTMCDGSAVGGNAQAWGPNPGGSTCAAFRTDKTWTSASPPASGKLSFPAVAVHEVGHNLGIGHSGWATAVMYPSAPVSLLSMDDYQAAVVLTQQFSYMDCCSEDVDVDDGGLFHTVYVTGAPAVSGGWTVWAYTNGGPWQDLTGSSGIGGERISSDSSRGLWIVQDDGDIYERTGGTWTKRPGCATDIAVGPDGTVWSLGCNTSTGDYRIYKWNGSDWTRDAATNASAVRISVGRRLDSGVTVPWIVKANGTLWRRSSNGTSSSGTWSSLPGSGSDIAANASGYTWSLSRSTWEGNFTVQAWDEQPAANIGSPTPVAKAQWISVAGAAMNIATSSLGNPVVVNSAGDIWWYY